MTENPADTTPADIENDGAQEPAEPAEAPASPEEAPLSGDSGSEQPAAQDEPEPEAPAAEAEEAPAAEVPAVAPDTEAPPPGAGPKILGMAEDVTPPPVPAVKESLKDLHKRERPRRRRLNATQRHRNVFFARLNEFRRQAQQGNDPEAAAEAADAAEAQAQEQAAESPVETTAEPVTDAGEAPAATTEAPAEGEQPAVTDAGEAADEAPVAEAPAEEAPTAEASEPPRQQQRRSAPPPQIDQARLVAAIDRAGGPDAIMEALQPKRDEHDQPLKWATVCADACKGLKPSDPVFSAWVRLAATPVSAIKRELGLNDRPDRGGRRGGPGRGRDGGRGPRREGRGGGDRVSREDLQRLSHGGTVGANIRIIGLDQDAEKKEREARRKAEREAKRQAERDRLARLGY